MQTPAWVDIALAYVGTKEVQGDGNNPFIEEMWTLGKCGPKQPDSTAWCAVFGSACVELAGYVSARDAFARNWLKWGQKLEEPCVGAIAILERGPNYGHLIIVLGCTVDGKLVAVAGNTQDQVEIAAYDRGRVLGYRWPPLAPVPEIMTLQVMSADGSSKEA